MDKKNSDKYTLRFNLGRVILVPKKSINKNSKDLIFDIATYLQRKIKDERVGILIDRHENQNSNSREMFVSSCYFKPRESKIIFSLALLRKNRVPMLKPRDKFKIVPIDELKDGGDITEVTHFFIDYSTNVPIICYESNYYGPRRNDIEYYLRHIGRDLLKEVVKTSIEDYANEKLADVIQNFDEILEVEIKALPSEVDKLDAGMSNKIFSGLNSFAKKYRPRFVKLAASFHLISPENKGEASRVFHDLLRLLRAQPKNKDAFRRLVIVYNDKNGNEDRFSLEGETCGIEIETAIAKPTTGKKYFELIEEKFDKFVHEVKNS